MGLTHHLVHLLSSKRGTFQCWRGGGVGEGRRERNHCFLPPWGFSSGLWHSIPTPPLISHFIEQLVLIECTWAETPPHSGPGQCFVFFFFFPLLLWNMRGAPVPLRWRCLVKFPGRSANPPGTPLPWPGTELTCLHGGQPAGLYLTLAWGPGWLCSGHVSPSQGRGRGILQNARLLPQGAGSLPSFQDGVVSVPLPH